ncbi:transporter substrate-binding domain-containing protein [Ponticoccus alexandrii]|uniref:histidine kinase n=1 Tax=Ponticoccus alexandrii TaxID=1943633 RepID=A0ABX7F601_9RHOB|nr:transporter substrate-binding domain-containing protein [Ponticoccus alexandrii]QRF65212.1 transporter substrate-binding domain-containing protein [Ponticoccus alexandrii]
MIALFRPLALALALLGAAGTATAQDEAPLVSGWTPTPGFFTPVEGDGPPSGFFGDIGQEIAARSGIDITFRKLPDVISIIRQQASGEAQILPGAARIPALADSNVFSAPVAESEVHLFVRADAPPERTRDSFDGLSLGVVDRTAGADMARGIGTDNTVIAYPDFGAALGALLFGQIDGLVAVYPGVMGVLRANGLEAEVRRLGPALATTRHVVALHDSRADLMPRVQEALDAMEADGTLAGLRRKWAMDVPAPPPQVYVVGVPDFPPYQMQAEDGRFTGFGVEVLRDLADRAGMPLRFVPITNEQFAEGPRSGQIDLISLVGFSDDRRNRMDFTLPLDSASFSLFERRGAARVLADDNRVTLDDLDGLRVGIEGATVVRALIPEAAGLDLVAFDGQEALFDALVDNQIDVALYLTTTGTRALGDLGLDGRIAMHQPPLLTSEGGIALRFGLAGTRERLNAVIPGYLSSPRYETLRREWYGTPQFWTPERLRVAGYAIAAAAVLSALSIALVSLRGRRQAEALNRQIAMAHTRMGAILDATRGAVLGLARSGDILVANPSAQEMLALGPGGLPKPWPDAVTFLDREDLAPLEASHDPMQRALAGQVLKGEVALLQVPGARSKRYVRVSSAPVGADDPGGLHSVLILDDVSEQEANRQQLERATRLDALGQLTGGVAHDFNNLLATIEYAVQLAAPEASPRAQGFLDTALQTIHRGAALTKRLLAFAKQQPGLARSYPVETVLKDFEALSRPSIEKSITLEFTIDEPDLYVHCDALQLGNALLNLVLNSRDAILRSGTGDRITVLARAALHSKAAPLAPDASARVVTTEGLKAEGAVTKTGKVFRYVEFSVSDNGPGMTDEVKRRAVDPFFTTRESNSGTGLGLSMVYGFVQQSNGELRIYSEVGKGTSVRILLPRGTAEGGGREKPVPMDDPEEGRGETLLVVEDDEGLLRVIRDMLEQMNYRVISAASGNEAITIIDEGVPFDLMLSDVVMPGRIGGFELARHLRDKRPDMPIVYMSGYTGIARTEMGEVPAPLMQKPCPRRVLAEVLRRQLDSPGTE